VADKTIVHLRSSEFFGGPERAIIGQCAHLPEFEFVCASFSRKDSTNSFLQKCAEAGLQTYELRERHAGDIRPVFQLMTLIHQHRARLVVTHDYKSTFFMRLIERHCGVRHMRHFRGFTWEDRRVRLYNAIDRYNMVRLDRMLAVSDRSAQTIAAFGVHRDRISVVPNAIERGRYAPKEFERVARFDKQMLLVSAGRLSHEKGHDVLVRAVALLDSDIDVHIDIYGDGPERSLLSSLIRKLGVEGRVQLHGFVPDVLLLLRDSDGMILPSRSEGMPNILLESWAQHCPVIVTAVGGVPEMVTHEIDGLVCQPDSPEDLARAIEWAYQNRESFASMGSNGFRTVAERYNYQAQAELLREIYIRELTK